MTPIDFDPDAVYAVGSVCPIGNRIPKKRIQIGQQEAVQMIQDLRMAYIAIEKKALRMESIILENVAKDAEREIFGQPNGMLNGRTRAHGEMVERNGEYKHD